jgi:hypothetical protein
MCTLSCTMQSWTPFGLKDSDWMLCSCAHLVLRRIAISANCWRFALGICMQVLKAHMWMLHVKSQVRLDRRRCKWRHESLILGISSCMLACSHGHEGFCALLVVGRAVRCIYRLASLLQPINKVQVTSTGTTMLI